MADSGLPLVIIIILSFTAVFVSLVVISQIVSTYTAAYYAAPNEVTTFIDAVDSSVQENESYDRDVAKVQKLEDKLRLGRLLREIQKCGDDLREDLNGLLIEESGTRLGTRLRTNARFLWALKRGRLEERVRRLDMLRMRFITVYMGIVADRPKEQQPPAKDPEKFQTPTKTASRPTLPHALTEGIVKKPPLRRLATQAMGHNDHSGGVQKMGWAGVVAELQRSPLMHKRHASIEQSLASPRGT